MRTGPQAGDGKLSVAAEREIGDPLPRLGIEGHHVGAIDAGSVLDHPAGQAAGRLVESVVRIQIRNARDIIRREHPRRNIAGWQRGRKHEENFRHLAERHFAGGVRHVQLVEKWIRESVIELKWDADEK